MKSSSYSSEYFGLAPCKVVLEEIPKKILRKYNIHTLLQKKNRLPLSIRRYRRHAMRQSPKPTNYGSMMTFEKRRAIGLCLKKRNKMNIRMPTWFHANNLQHRYTYQNCIDNFSTREISNTVSGSETETETSSSTYGLSKNISEGFQSEFSMIESGSCLQDSISSIADIHTFDSSDDAKEASGFVYVSNIRKYSGANKSNSQNSSESSSNEFRSFSTSHGTSSDSDEYYEALIANNYATGMNKECKSNFPPESYSEVYNTVEIMYISDSENDDQEVPTKHVVMGCKGLSEWEATNKSAVSTNMGSSDSFPYGEVVYEAGVWVPYPSMRSIDKRANEEKESHFSFCKTVKGEVEQ